jgi:transcriptional regulator with XRE-family HTH domain
MRAEIRDQERWKDEAARLVRLIQAIQRLLGVTNRQIERRLGLSSSSLSRLFKGLIALRFEHIASIVDALGLRLEEFFWLAYPAKPGERSAAAQQIQSVLGLFDSRHRSADEVEAIEALVEDMVRRTAAEDD